MLIVGQRPVLIDLYQENKENSFQPLILASTSSGWPSNSWYSHYTRMGTPFLSLYTKEEKEAFFFIIKLSRNLANCYSNGPFINSHLLELKNNPTIPNKAHK
ncbi:hypothetical protein AMTRI_Chr10g850 [Amborella trichopoda]